MEKFIIRAHYYPGKVHLGIVEAANERDALNQAESEGMLDDPDAVDFTATRVAKVLEG